MKTFLKIVLFFLLETQICFAQWYQQNSGTTKNLNAIQFLDANNGFAVGDSGLILRTTNGGEMWNIQSCGTTLQLNDISFVDANNGFIVGGSKNTIGVGLTEGIILKTNNGGDSWLKQFEDTTDVFIGMNFSDSVNGWIVGSNTVWKTMDIGLNWFQAFANGWYGLSDVYSVNRDTAIAVGVIFLEGRGNYSTIMRTIDGGTNWDIKEFNDGFGGLHGVCPVGSNSIIAVGGMRGWDDIGYGIITKTMDWGSTWTTDSIAGLSFNNAYFVDSNNGWIVGGNYFGSNGEYSESFILRTMDGGATWAIQMSDTVNLYSDVFFTNIVNGWIVGNNGTIIHTTNGGVTFIEDEQTVELPTQFILSQNYPNPFNSSTTIKYSIPKHSNLTLKVFDVLGSEIATLVNKEQSQGNYEVAFDGSDLTSGIYFYTLKAGKFIETKKFILLK